METHTKLKIGITIENTGKSFLLRGIDGDGALFSQEESLSVSAKTMACLFSDLVSGVTPIGCGNCEVTLSLMSGADVWSVRGRVVNRRFVSDTRWP